MQREQQMGSDSAETMICITINACYPLTLFVISMCCAVRMDRVPITYYINLLVLNLIFSVCVILSLVYMNNNYLHYIFDVICGCCLMGGLYFRMIIALERCFFISRPQLLFIRQTKGSVMICVLVWVFCAVSFPLCEVFKQLVVLIVAFTLPGLIFIICLILTLRSLCAATYVSTEEKHRVVATLFFLLFIFAVIYLSLSFLTGLYFDNNFLYIEQSFWIVLLSSFFMDLILFVVMRKGLIDKLLTCLCCCRMENTAGSDSSRGTSEAQTDQPTDRKNESQEEESKM